MRGELTTLVEESRDILRAIPDRRLHPSGWQRVSDLLEALSDALERGDWGAFRRSLGLLEDLVVAWRSPRDLPEETDAPEPVLERRAVLQDRLAGLGRPGEESSGTPDGR